MVIRPRTDYCQLWQVDRLSTLARTTLFEKNFLIKQLLILKMYLTHLHRTYDNKSGTCLIMSKENISIGFPIYTRTLILSSKRCAQIVWKNTMYPNYKRYYNALTLIRLNDFQLTTGTAYINTYT
jgi:hypothetical protein